MAAAAMVLLIYWLDYVLLSGRLRDGSGPRPRALDLLFFGCLMWMSVFGPLPKPEWFGAGWKVAYVIAVRFTGAILGNVLMWSGSVLYPIYAPGERYWGISGLADQSTAGALMMVEGTFLALGVLAWTFFELAREGDRSSACSSSPKRTGSSSTSGGTAGGRRRPRRAARAAAVGRAPGFG